MNLNYWYGSIVLCAEGIVSLLLLLYLFIYISLLQFERVSSVLGIPGNNNNILMQQNIKSE